ncbi:unnamed protein product [Heligmosomoides polygyrus]|uniref:LRRCT domain-containing protein n=1 Tax=Heligmosomoides polygyrus TaxID=6339 RepID=A0A3P8B0Z8_HELPZ|nr:unnamed protein product [Heligmosomoides polygyrus]
MALLRENALGTIGPRLHGLYLRNNHLKGVNRSMLQGLSSLRELDLSGNRISSLGTGVFDLTPELRELSINDNDISVIEEGTFSKLTSLKKLSLSGNQISTITKNMFKGLDSLEVLNLQNNQITSIDWSAFANLKQLRTLDLGTNHFNNVELRGLENLQKLFLNNNSINSLKSVSLRDLPSLILLSFDRNSISEIADGDLSGLARSTRLESLTIAANNISQISQRAFSPVQHLNVLAMQNNQLTTLTKGKYASSRNSICFVDLIVFYRLDGQSYLRPLRRLTTLLVSGNQLRAIGEHDLPRTLLVLAADHNLLEKVCSEGLMWLVQIDVKAFDGMTLHKLFINNNKLPFLHRHTFDSISFDTLEAIDITCRFLLWLEFSGHCSRVQIVRIQLGF